MPVHLLPRPKTCRFVKRRLSLAAKFIALFGLIEGILTALMYMNLCQNLYKSQGMLRNAVILSVGATTTTSYFLIIASVCFFIQVFIKWQCLDNLFIWLLIVVPLLNMFLLILTSLRVYVDQVKCESFLSRHSAEKEKSMPGNSNMLIAVSLLGFVSIYFSLIINLYSIALEEKKVRDVLPIQPESTNTVRSSGSKYIGPPVPVQLKVPEVANTSFMRLDSMQRAYIKDLYPREPIILPNSREISQSSRNEQEGEYKSDHETDNKSDHGSVHENPDKSDHETNNKSDHEADNKSDHESVHDSPHKTDHEIDHQNTNVDQSSSVQNKPRESIILLNSRETSQSSGNEHKSDHKTEHESDHKSDSKSDHKSDQDSPHKSDHQNTNVDQSSSVQNKPVDDNK